MSRDLPAVPDLPAVRTGPGWDVVGLAGLFVASGTTHLVRPQVFEPIVPPALPRRRELVYASGVAELACAAGLLVPGTRRAAGWASAALLVAIFPANVQMAIDHGRRARRRRDPQAVALFAGTVARLPLQVPLVLVALRAARGTRSTS